MQHHEVVAFRKQLLARGSGVGEFAIGLVDHNEARTRGAHLTHEFNRSQIARWIVRRGHDCDIAFQRRLKHRRLVELERFRITPHIEHLGLRKRCEKRVFRKAWRTVEQRAAHAAKSEQEVIKQLVTAVAHARPRWIDAVPRGDFRTQLVRHGVGVAIKRRSRERGIDGRARRSRHGIRVLVRRKVHAARREIRVVGLDAR